MGLENYSIQYTTSSGGRYCSRYFSVRYDVLVFSAADFGGDLVSGAVSSETLALGAATTEQHRCCQVSMPL